MLLDEFLRFVEELQPWAIFFENVPGIEKYHRFTEFVRKLVKLEYQVAWKPLELSDYGVPQRRRRIVLLAGLGFEIEFPRKSPRKRTVGDAIKGLPRPAKRRRNRLHREKTRHSSEMMVRIKATPKKGGSRKHWPEALKLDCHDGFDGFKDVYGRMSWDDVAPTITSGCINASKGRFLHPSQNRTITLLEAAVLQTFRQRYRFPLDRGRYQVAKLIGNALPPKFAERVGRRILAALEENCGG